MVNKKRINPIIATGVGPGKSRQSKTIRKLRINLDEVAYASLIVDIAIAIITVVSIFIGTQYTITAMLLLNYILTLIVIIAIILFLAILFLSHSKKLAFGS